MKLLFKIVAALVLVLALAAGLLLIFVGPLVRAALESGGTWATGVETRCGDVSAGLIGGELSLADLSVANPPGFAPEPFLELRAARAAWENRSLFGGQIHVRELAVDGLALRLERNAKGTNYAAILDRLKALSERPAADSPGHPPEPAAAGRQRTLLVDHIVLRDLSAELRLSGLPISTAPLVARVPRIEIDGFRSDGDTTAIIGRLLGAIVQAALDASLEAGHGTFPQDLEQDLRQRLGDVKGLLRGGEGALQQAGQALQGLGDLFKKPKAK